MKETKIDLGNITRKDENDSEWLVRVSRTWHKLKTKFAGQGIVGCRNNDKIAFYWLRKIKRRHK